MRYFNGGVDVGCELSVDVFYLEGIDETMTNLAGDSDGKGLECTVQEIEDVDCSVRVVTTGVDAFEEVFL